MKQEYDREKRVGTIIFDGAEERFSDQEIITAFLVIDPEVQRIWLKTIGLPGGQGNLSRNWPQGQWHSHRVDRSGPVSTVVVFKRARLVEV